MGLQSSDRDGFETLRVLTPTFQLSCFPVAQGRGVEGQSPHIVTVVKNQPLLVEIKPPPSCNSVAISQSISDPFFPDNIEHKHSQTLGKGSFSALAPRTFMTINSVAFCMNADRMKGEGKSCVLKSMCLWAYVKVLHRLHGFEIQSVERLCCSETMYCLVILKAMRRQALH